MKKKLLPLVTAVALLTMPVSQAMAAPKPTPPASNTGGQMDMTSSQMAASQPQMSGWDMVKMRTTAKMRAKAARNAKLKGKPAQAVAASSYDPAKGPDYFGTTPNYASSPMPRITWRSDNSNVILPVYDPTTNVLTDPATGATVTVANSPYAADPADATGNTPLLDPINQIPQLDPNKVNIAGGIRKFVQPLAGLGAPAAGALQNLDANKANPTAAYIPIAVPDTTTYPGSDYYEIGLKDYYQQFSPDLPPTHLRGYYQMNGPDPRPYYLGPIIQATANRPVRVKFVNQLPAGSGGDLFLPVDTTAMGAGVGPDGTTAYGQNRAVIHLHGGLTPWISDGTPNQWTTPVGDTSKYPKGVSVYGVPDMPAVSGPTDSGAANDGTLTFFYTNKQSARLMWYHDHAYGLTRLNVYAGEVSAYQLNSDKAAQGTDPAAANYDPASAAQNAFDALMPSAVPLVIQDKGFVPDDIPSGYFPDGQLTDQDPTWNRTKWGGPAAGGATDGALWFPHVYMPNQNPYDNSGANAMGRWDYGPWFWPIFGTSAGLVHGEVANPYASPAAPWEPPFIPGTPSTYTNGLPKSDPAYSPSDVSLAPEAFVDTAVVNGVAYPYMDVTAKPYRFQILNGANDRYWNLQMYCSAADVPAPVGSGLYTTANAAPMWASSTDTIPANAAAGEVPMVPAVRTPGMPGNWAMDGRDGGTPYWKAAAGHFIQVATEGGVLPNTVDVRNGPVTYNYNRRDIVVLNIQDHGLLLGPAERADVIYDFADAANMGCKNVILYNDSPTPVPAFDPRNDYYTNNPDQTDSGGTPSTLPGYGPNTRTLVQFRITDATGGGVAPAAAFPTFNEAAVVAAQPGTFAAVQHKPIVPDTRYAAAYPGDPIGASDVYSRIQSTSLTFNASSVGDVQSLVLGTAGSGYAPTATVTAPAGFGSGAVLVPVINGAGQIQSVTVVNGGSGYASAGANRPVITISTPVAAGAVTAQATANVVNGVIATVTVPNNRRGSGYSSGATVSIAAGAGNVATGIATVNMNTGAIGSVTLTDGGSSYTAVPAVDISAPLYVGGVQATASATLVAPSPSTVKMDMAPKAIQELFEMDYGRMNATLGVELPFTNSLNQTTLPMGYAEPTTEYLKPSDVQGATQIGSTRDGTAIWKITHNGVDTHTIHFHLMDVQLVNRVGWDGAIRPGDDNEIGWKESVRMNPLEDAIVAMRPATPQLPFKIGDSIRSIDPTMPANHQMSSLDPLTGQAITFSNTPVNMGWEYVWHCHLLGHEENDMMREVNFAGSPDAPTIGTATASPNGGLSGTITVTWKNNANWQLTNFVVQRSENADFTGPTTKQTLSDKGALTGGGYVNWQGNKATLGAALGKGTQLVDQLTDAATESGKTFYYRVRAESAQGFSQWSSSVQVVGPTFTAAPTAPVLGAVVDQNQQSTVTLTTPSALTAGGTFSKYQYSLNNGGTWLDFTPSVTNANVASFTLTGLTNGQTYSLTVRGVSTDGSGAASNAVTLAPALPDPKSVVLTRALAGANARITVAWTGVRSTGVNANVNYVVRWSTDSTFATGVQTRNVAGQTGNPGTAYSINITNGNNGATLARGTVYYVQVQAVLTGSAPSAWVPGTFAGPPATQSITTL